MLTIEKLTPLQKLCTTVRAALMSHEDYVTKAKTVLSSEAPWSEKDLDSFLRNFDWNPNLIGVIFTKSITTPEHVLTILKKINYNRMLCEHAGDAYSDDDEFIFSMLVYAYDTNPRSGQLLTSKFAQSLSRDGRSALLHKLGKDPKISTTLNHLLQKAA